MVFISALVLLTMQVLGEEFVELGRVQSFL